MPNYKKMVGRSAKQAAKLGKRMGKMAGRSAKPAIGKALKLQGLGGSLPKRKARGIKGVNKAVRGVGAGLKRRLRKKARRGYKGKG